jgi:hypothetical protein
MKINTVLIIVIVFGILLIAGYTIKSMTSPVVGPLTNTTWDAIEQEITDPGSSPGQLNVSIGQFPAEFSVSVDNADYGVVSANTPFSHQISNGIHTVTICKNSDCTTTHVLIEPGIITTIDFENILNEDISQGSLNVTIGDYPDGLNVYIDNSSAGKIYPGIPFSQTLASGHHGVQVCTNTTCLSQGVEITPMNITTADFQNQLINNTNLLQTNLVVSIGEYNADLPVNVDKVKVGNVSMGVPLTVKVIEGTHNISVCSGSVCENSQVTTKFGKTTYVDFGASLQKDALHQTPWAEVAGTLVSGNDVTVTVMLYNPTANDTTMSAIVSCLYQYLDYQGMTRTDTASSLINNQYVEAGGNVTYLVDVYMSEGMNPVLLGKPVILSMKST